MLRITPFPSSDYPRYCLSSHPVRFSPSLRFCAPHLTFLNRSNSTFFSTSTSTLADPPRVGDVVTFSFTNFTKSGYPIDPVLVRRRLDLDWESVLAHQAIYERPVISSMHLISLTALSPYPILFLLPSQSQYYLNALPFFPHFVYSPFTEITEKAFGSPVPRKPHGHWSVEGGKNKRLFFDALLHSRGKDPLIAENWYKITHDDVIAEEVLTYSTLAIIYRV